MDATEPLDRSDAVARTVARRAGRGTMTRQWERRLRRNRRATGIGDRAMTSVEDVLSVGFAGVIAGEAPTAEGASEMLLAAGLDDGQDPAEVAAVLGQLHIDQILDAIRSAKAEDWQRARTASESLFDMMRLRRAAEVGLAGAESGLVGLDDFASHYNDPTFASRVELTPVFLLLATPDWLDSLQHNLALFRALEALIDDLPPHTHQYLGPTGTEALKAATEQDRDEAIKLMAEWLHDHPEHAAVLNEATGEPDQAQI
ncbi:hypothetical protein [Actinoplanes sp. NPDC026619]|uniref:hypothetical protein n=1 Tax=Actinoplanes sp. NPDC026619 TaxID=3155798 RepID=UPI0033C5D107